MKTWKPKFLTPKGKKEKKGADGSERYEHRCTCVTASLTGLGDLRQVIKLDLQIPHHSIIERIKRKRFKKLSSIIHIYPPFTPPLLLVNGE